jgi:hypothetical protein
MSIIISMDIRNRNAAYADRILWPVVNRRQSAETTPRKMTKVSYWERRGAVGFFDFIFGSREELDLGGTKRHVTSKWLAEMKHRGLMQPLLRVHTIGKHPEFDDPWRLREWLESGQPTYRVETWTIGVESPWTLFKSVATKKQANSTFVMLLSTTSGITVASHEQSLSS